MCNNLLQFAHVYAWAREHNRRVMSMRFSYKYPYFRISDSKLVSFPLYLLAKTAAAMRILPTASFKHDNCDVAALERKMLRCRHIVVAGWYVRYYELFLKYRAEICQLFEIKAELALPVREKMTQTESGSSSPLRLGLHIRRGDYAQWHNGAFFYDDERYAQYVARFAAMHPDREVHVYLATNDPAVTAENFRRLLDGHRNVMIHHFSGTGIEDLYMLSACDYIIGPPSTYSLVAAMYRDIPLCRMDTVEPTDMQEENFRRFDYWFRRIE